MIIRIGQLFDLPLQLFYGLLLTSLLFKKLNFLPLLMNDLRPARLSHLFDLLEPLIKQNDELPSENLAIQLCLLDKWILRLLAFLLAASHLVPSIHLFLLFLLFDNVIDLLDHVLHLVFDFLLLLTLQLSFFPLVELEPLHFLIQQYIFFLHLVHHLKCALSAHVYVLNQ